MNDTVKDVPAARATVAPIGRGASPPLAALAKEYNAGYAKLGEIARAGLAQAIANGRVLLLARPQVDRGFWTGWINKNCKGSLRMAQVSIRLAEHEGEIEGDLAEITINQALQQISDRNRPPAPPRPPAREPPLPERQKEKWAPQPPVIDLDPEPTAEPATEAPAKLKKSNSRPARWADAAARAIAALEELQELQSEYQDWQENLPENLQDGSLAEKLQAVADIDLQSAIDIATEAQDADLPLGFGRD